MTTKKSYNPFKMWGSYVGALLLVLLLIFFVLLHDNKIIGGGKAIVENSLTLSWIVTFGTFGGIIGYPLALLFGFLIGWAIHSLIRRLRK